MIIRYQNGTAIEAVTLSRTAQIMRVAIKDGDDAMELTNIHGAWVSEDCEPVVLEIGMTSKTIESESVEDFICSPELAGRLVRLLFSGSTEDLLEEQSLVNPLYTAASTMIA
jgi:hypothetical protein